MHRMAAGLPLGWHIDLEDLGNEHGKPKIQPCNAFLFHGALRLALQLLRAA
jgi:hypothetical protein